MIKKRAPMPPSDFRDAIHTPLQANNIQAYTKLGYMFWRVKQMWNKLLYYVKVTGPSSPEACLQQWQSTPQDTAPRTCTVQASFQSC